MSYTAPQYVDTKEQAVLALASVIADEDKTALGNGSVNRALDVLADVLAQQDVEVPQTNAGAILALAQYVGGGGGAEIGELQTVTVYYASTAPTVGMSIDELTRSDIYSVSIGGAEVAVGNITSLPVGSSIFAGGPLTSTEIISAYSVTSENSSSGGILTRVIKTVEQIPLDATFDENDQGFEINNIPRGTEDSLFGRPGITIVLHVTNA